MNFFRQLWFYGLKDSFRTPTPRVMGLSLLITLLYYALLYILHEYFVDFDFEIPGFVVYSLGYVIAILFYFRLNNSYYRWNDGNKAIHNMQANLVVFVMKINQYVGKEFIVERHYLREMSKNLYWSFCDFVHNERNPHNLTDLEPNQHEQLLLAYNVPTAVNKFLIHKSNELLERGIITKYEFWDLHRGLIKNNEFISSCDALKSSPPPVSYIIHIRGFIIGYMLMIPFGFLQDFQAWLALFLAIFFYFYAGLEVISDEIEDPFGNDENDLPVMQLADETDRQIQQQLN